MPKRNALLRRGGVASVSASLLGAAFLYGAPTASAEVIRLDNGLTVNIDKYSNENNREPWRLVTITGIPRVGDYVTQVVNFRFPDGSQFEKPIENGRVVMTILPNQTEVAVQACRPFDFAPSKCTEFSTFFPYKESPPPRPAPPAPAPAPAPPPVETLVPAPPPPAPAAPTATVTSDVDLYDKPGGVGNVIGVLRGGQVVKVVTPCPANDWCQLADGVGWAFGSFLRNN